MTDVGQTQVPFLPAMYQAMPNHAVGLVHLTPDADKLIAGIARVSNPGNQDNEETYPKLIRYLIDHKHWSPFEMASACFMVETTRDIGRQILRHRSFSFQEFSGRYAEYADLRSDREIRLQHTTNRQASIEIDAGNLEQYMLAEHIMRESSRSQAEAYRRLLALGVAKEQARAVLPEGLTPTTMYMHGTIRSWIHYIAERTHFDYKKQSYVAQKEHRLIAQAIGNLLFEEMPLLRRALSDYFSGFVWSCASSMLRLH